MTPDATCHTHPAIPPVLGCARCGTPCCESCYVELAGAAHCAACKLEYVRDLHSGEDPRHLELATTERRIGAWILDSFVVGVPAFALAIAVFARFAPADPPRLVQVLLGIGVWSAALAYEAVLLARGGQTLGKRARGIRVMSASGAPIGRGQAWARALAHRILAVFLVDYIPAFLTPQRTCVHDLLARTRVVRWRE